MSQYRTVIAPSSAALDKRVMEWIALGWILQGGVSVASDGKDIIFAQAMVKEQNYFDPSR